MRTYSSSDESILLPVRGPMKERFKRASAKINKFKFLIIKSIIHNFNKNLSLQTYVSRHFQWLVFGLLVGNNCEKID